MYVISVVWTAEEKLLCHKHNVGSDLDATVITLKPAKITKALCILFLMHNQLIMKLQECLKLPTAMPETTAVSKK